VWEATYFDHDLAKLTELADLAARVGVERFVLDDGWFGARRDDTAGLGDWYVLADVWPDGLGPLIDRVRYRGMGFGLWFEPEMVNPDSNSTGPPRIGYCHRRRRRPVGPRFSRPSAGRTSGTTERISAISRVPDR
jgi:alpha-galactosidase